MSSSSRPLAGKCGWCRLQDGNIICTKCIGVVPPKVYCSEECQKADWRASHKKYCRKYAYTFELTLSESSNPVITRTFDVPSSFTFQQFHYAIQYVMGTWENYHLHDFTFHGLRSSDARRVKEVLRIIPEDAYEEEWDMAEELGPKLLMEGRVKLTDVFGEGGKWKRLTSDPVTGETFSAIYNYDYGDCWEHEIQFKGQKPACAARPIVTYATGRGPVEDSGGVWGWNDVKSAFRARNPTTNQEERKEWARNITGLGDSFDPFEEPDIALMNDEERWESHFKECIRKEYEEDDEFDYYSD